MRKFFQVIISTHSLGGWICLLTSIGLMVFSAIMPPPGVIDSSVLAAGGELFAFATLFQLPKIVASIKEGRKVMFKHNDTEISVESENCE